MDDNINFNLFEEHKTVKFKFNGSSVLQEKMREKKEHSAEDASKTIFCCRVVSLWSNKKLTGLASGCCQLADLIKFTSFWEVITHGPPESLVQSNML